MTLTEIGNKHGTDKANYHGFTDFYAEQLKDRDIRTILEIGILSGSSLRMWHEYFPKAIVIGIDVQKPLEIPGVVCLQGDATDWKYLHAALKNLQFDLMIDDGSHKTADQITTFEALFDSHLTKGGVYICEDIHTSFRKEYINSETTAYEYFQIIAYPDIVRMFWKDPKDKTDSGTCLLIKS